MKNLKWLVFILVAVILVAVPLVAACEEEPPTNGEEPPTNGEEPPTNGEPPPEVIELTYGSAWSPPHPIAASEEAWIEKIEEETDGRVHITPYWGGSLVSFTETYVEVSQGVADMAWFIPGYASSGFEIVKHATLFSVGVDSFEDQYQIFLDIYEAFPEVRAEFADVKLFERATTTSGPWQLLTTDKPVYTIEDFEDLQLRTTSMWVDITEALGAVPVPMSASDVYISLQKGTIDGAFGIIDQLSSLNLAEVVNYVTLINVYAAVTNYLIMNLDTWNSLPTDIQQVFEDNAEFYAFDQHERLATGDTEGFELGEQLGVEFIEMAPAELDRFNEVVASIAAEEAAVLDAEGLPGTEMFNAIRSLVEEYTQ